MSPTPSKSRKEIEKRRHEIFLRGYDIIGSDAGKNVDRMRELRKEIANIEEYGVPNPSLIKQLLHKVGRSSHE